MALAPQPLLTKLLTRIRLLQELKSNDSLFLRGLCVGSSPIGGANPPRSAYLGQLIVNFAGIRTTVWKSENA
jgi:hypothetical protein